jgi:hypothetical protein
VSESMLVNRFMPRYDAVRVERKLLMGDPASVWDAVLEAGFMRTAEEMPAVRLLIGARCLAERAVAAVRGDPAPTPSEPESMRLRDLEPHGEWVRLSEDPPHEVVFGAIGRFWAGETVWKQIDASEFASFAEPGMAKIACSFSLRLCEEHRTLVSYECRALATDPSARRAFMRYWRFLSQFIGFVLRAQLRTIETTLEEAARLG